MADAYIAAAGIDAPPAEPTPTDDWLPAESGARLDLAAVDWGSNCGNCSAVVGL